VCVCGHRRWCGLSSSSFVAIRFDSPLPLLAVGEGRWRRRPLGRERVMFRSCGIFFFIVIVVVVVVVVVKSSRRRCVESDPTAVGLLLLLPLAPSCCCRGGSCADGGKAWRRRRRCPCRRGGA
jgi:hypothetical protein